MHAQVHQHLAAMVRAHKVVDAEGKDVYLTGTDGMKGLEGMRLPITHSKDVIEELT